MTTEISTHEFELTKSEYRSVLRRVLIRRNGWAGILFGAVVAYLVLRGVGTVSWPTMAQRLGNSLPLVLAVAVWWIWVLVAAPVIVSNCRRSRPVYYRQSLRFTEHHVEARLSDGTRVVRPNECIEDAELRDGMLMLRQDTGMFFVVPQRAFAQDAELQAVMGLFQRADLTDRTAPRPAADGGWLRDARHNLLTTLRLMFFRAVGEDDFAASTDQALLLAVLSVIVTAGVQYLLLDGPVRFNQYALGGHGFGLLLIMVGAYLIARWHGRVDALPLFLVMLAGLEAVFAPIVTWADPTYVTLSSANASHLVGVGVVVWLLLAWHRSVRVSFKGGRLKALGSVALLVALGLASVSVALTTDYWYALDDAVDDAPRLNVEDVFYRQPALVETTISALQPQRPGVVDLYHIGFGSYAYQDVFRRELLHVKAALDQRFDTTGRSALLLNHNDTVDELPIASRSNLRLALNLLAQRMDPQEDVLLLYLTSHGSAGAELSVDFWPLDLNSLDGSYLRRTLDESGIKWKIVIISACYAGSFVDALKDDNTLVIAAAAPDRRSFGCSSTSEYTYFGEAYFKDALGRTRSFTKAFEIARDLVMKRERKEGRKPSRPVMHAGGAITEHLRKLERRLASADALVPASQIR